jgi:hypothetical protein
MQSKTSIQIKIVHEQQSVRLEGRNGPTFFVYRQASSLLLTMTASGQTDKNSA